jgi:hypothetical protein
MSHLSSKYTLVQNTLRQVTAFNTHVHRLSESVIHTVAIIQYRDQAQAVQAVNEESTPLGQVANNRDPMHDESKSHVLRLVVSRILESSQFISLGFTVLVIFVAHHEAVRCSSPRFSHGTHVDSMILRVREGSADLAVLLLPVPNHMHVCGDAKRTPAASS